MQQYSQIIFLVVIVGAFYLLLIRPQQQQAKRQAEMVARLTPGTEVLTVGGLHATVVSLGGDRVRVRVADGSEMEFAPRAISAVTKRSDDEDLEADAEEADAEDALAEDAQASEPDAPALDGGFATSSSDEGKDDAPDA